MQDRDVYVIRDEGLGPPADQAPTGKSKENKKDQRHRRSDANVDDDGSGWPRLAATFSIWLSGSGHFLHREWRRGFPYLLLLGFAPSFYYLLHNFWSSIVSLAGRFDLGETDLLMGVLLIDINLILVLLLGVYSAYRVGQAYSGDDIDPSPYPLWPALASMLVPGWGQVVNGQIRKAMVFLFVVYTGVFALATWLVLPGPIERLIRGYYDPVQTLFVGFALATLGIVVWTLSLYDAVLVARYRRLCRLRPNLSRSHFQSGMAMIRGE